MFYLNVNVLCLALLNVCLIAMLHVTETQAEMNNKLTSLKSNAASDSKQSSDYDYNDEGDDDSAGNAGNSLDNDLSSKTKVLPYFEHNTTTVHISNPEKVILPCTPKNFDENQHVILWYKDTSPITNGNTTLSAGYEVDNKYRLTILNYKRDGILSNYSCLVMPNQIRQYIDIRYHSDNIPDNIQDVRNSASNPSMHPCLQNIHKVSILVIVMLMMLRMLIQKSV